MAKIVNLIGGPGSGKSTTAAAVYGKLKEQGYNCFLVREFAEELVRQNHVDFLVNNQLFVSAEQWRRENVGLGSADYVITDSPMLLSPIYYQDEDENFHKIYEDLFVGLFNKRDNLTIFLERPDSFSMEGRAHNLDESIEKDKQIVALLGRHRIPYQVMKVDGNISNNVVKWIEEQKI